MDSHLTTPIAKNVVSTGPLIDMPGWQQAEGAIARLYVQIIIKIAALIVEVAVSQLNTL